MVEVERRRGGGGFGVLRLWMLSKSIGDGGDCRSASAIIFQGGFNRDPFYPMEGFATPSVEVNHFILD